MADTCGGEAKNVRDMKKVRILIVEDETVIGRDIHFSLEALGYEVSGIEVSGEEALNSIARDRPDLVLMDIVLQGRMDGIEAARLISSKYSLPVVFLTAYADEMILERAKTSEPFGYLIKPFENKELHFAIEMALFKHRTQEQLRKVNRALKTLSQCNNTLVHATDKGELLKEICRIIVEVGGYPFAWVGLSAEDDVSAVEPAAWHGKEILLYRDFINIIWAGRNDAHHPLGTAVREAEPVVIQEIDSEKINEAWCAEASRLGFTSCCSFPLVSSGRTLGALSIYAFEAHSFDTAEFDLLMDLANNLAYGITALQDRLERERAEKALQDSHERFTMVLDSLEAIVYVADMDSDEILFANKYVRDIFGDVVGRICWETIQSGQSGRCWFCTNDKLVDSQGRPTGTNVWEFMNHADGKWYQMYDRAIQWVDGRLVRLAIATDITERKRAESELEKHQEHLEELVEERTLELQQQIVERRRAEQELLKVQKLESVGILAGGIAHDFNNILTSILTNISLAKISANGNNEIYKRLAAAEKASMRARDLTQQLLTFSKGGTPVKKTASIVDLLHETTNFALRGSNVRCELHIVKDLWPVVIDEGQIIQVLNNLIINADQAMPDGGILRMRTENVVVEASRIPPLKAGRYVMLTIEDEGVGIPDKYVHRIFDPYFTTKQEGSGLGLASTYSIVKNHDGHITVDSRPGHGTAFKVYLPASDKLPEKKPAETFEIHKGVGRILVMDDDEDIRESLGDALTVLGYSVAFAEDGSKTIELYRDAGDAGTPFDAVIMDLTVPGGMGGAEAVRELRKLDPDLKAIVSSGYSNDPVMSDYRKHGFSGVITKPYKIEDVSRMLRRVVSKRSKPLFQP